MRLKRHHKKIRVKLLSVFDRHTESGLKSDNHCLVPKSWMQEIWKLTYRVEISKRNAIYNNGTQRMR